MDEYIRVMYQNGAHRNDGTNQEERRMSAVDNGVFDHSAAYGGAMVGSDNVQDKKDHQYAQMPFQQIPQQQAMGHPEMVQQEMVNFGGQPGSSPLEHFQFDPATTGPMMINTSLFAHNGSQPMSAHQAPHPLSAGPHYMEPPSPFDNVHSPYDNFQMTLPSTGMGIDDQMNPNNMPAGMSFSENDLHAMMNHAAAVAEAGYGNVQSPHSPYDPTMLTSQDDHRYDLARHSSLPDIPVPPFSQTMQNEHQHVRRQSFHASQVPNHEEHSRRHSMSSHSPMPRAIPENPYGTAAQQRPGGPPSRTSSGYDPSPQHAAPPILTSQSQTAQYSTSHPQRFAGALPMRPPQNQNYVNAYSSTGFDMLKVLMRVATRKDTEINIGAVDLSCAFVVCDVTEHDCPIVYCSDNFERLTGYTKHEILGRNCRFLQAPDGRVQAGVKRSYVDDDAVLYLKNMIIAQREAQVSIINYRKGGQPFMNLLTMIPIPYETEEIRYIVGFQVDLVEQPNSVTNKNPDGTYTINYQRGLNMPRYVFTPNEKPPAQLEAGQTITRDDVSTVLATIGSEESELSKRIWDKVLLENTDDVVFVLSLKGLFLYLSPSSTRVLEYEPSELIGTALSSVCHPSDIVPVTRELKDTSTPNAVNVVFRFRRKNTGYMWFEGHGSLHTEQGKGRKSIVLVGRERPVYTLSKNDITASGGLGDSECWMKLSTSGMFLYVSSSIRAMLDRTPDELIGTSIQALMRPESRPDLLRILEIARTGKRAQTKHELINKRGQVLQAFSTIYPGDASEGTKPTFLISQTRLIKYSRPTPSKQNSAVKVERENVKSTAPQQTSNPTSMASPSRFMSTFEAATTYAGQHGLTIGRQDVALAAEENLFDELKTTRSTSWQFELRQMEKRNRLLAEELQSLLAARKKRKRRKGAGQLERDCANCHTRVTPEWRRGPSGARDLCNSCGLRWAKQQGRISPRTNASHRSVQSGGSGKAGGSPIAATGGAIEPSDPDKGQPGIEETLAETGLEDTSPNQGLQHSDDSNRHVDKMAKMVFTSSPTSPTSPTRRHSGGGAGVPTKIEEEEEGFELDDDSGDLLEEQHSEESMQT